MNRHVSLVLLGLLTLSLVGCSNHNKDYLKQAQTVQPIVVPEGTAVKPSASYYPIVNVPANGAQSPSLVPPGSNLDRFKNQSQAQPTGSQKNAVASASISRTTSGEALTLNIQPTVAWDRVGRALHQTAYKILDQDQSMGSYYVLDVVSTGGKITKTTPVYRVYLKDAGNQTNVVVLNQENRPAEKDAADRILTAVQKKLS